MKFQKYAGIALAAALTFAAPTAAVFAQSSDSGTKQALKNAGADTKHAAKDTGHAVKQGTKKSYHETKRVTKKGYNKTKHATKKVGHTIEGKPDTAAHNPQ